MTIDDRIAALRASMRRHGLDAYIIPSSDPHQSEYTARFWKAREWLSGFTGSAGLLVITKDHAGLWTDSRYFLQADTQLKDSQIELHKQQVPHAPEHVVWLADTLDPRSEVGCNGFLFSMGQIRHLERHFQPKDIQLHSDLDLISEIWPDRPPLPREPVYELDVRYTGESRRDKLARIRKAMTGEGAWHYLVTTLDDIAWTLNLRGSDVDFNPVFISYLLISPDQAFLFMHEGKVPEKIAATLSDDGVELRPYHAVEHTIEELPGEERVLLDPRSVNVRLVQALDPAQPLWGTNIPMQLKAVKNEVEIGYIRQAMRKDGVALVKLYRWLESILSKKTVSEYEVAHQLDHFRSAQGDYHGESFSAIVGYNSNGAIVHYRPDPEQSAEIRPSGLLLLDSGGQYTQGTTDITRTTALGEPSEAQRTHFTLVLKGHIALATIQFPEGTTGQQLDTLARMHLWRRGLNYGHGTGHGVGFFLNVHEPPQGFASNASTSRGTTAFKAGMFTSNEPGYYEAGAYGIRTENLVLCVEGDKTDFGSFLRFETLTLFPIDQSLLDPGLLTREEKQWLNTYHEQVFETLSPLLNPEEVDWLQEKCRPVA